MPKCKGAPLPKTSKKRIHPALIRGLLRRDRRARRAKLRQGPGGWGTGGGNGKEKRGPRISGPRARVSRCGGPQTRKRHARQPRKIRTKKRTVMKSGDALEEEERVEAYPRWDQGKGSVPSKTHQAPNGGPHHAGAVHMHHAAGEVSTSGPTETK